jgi:UDP-N-acetylmuramate--alanine ligase
VSGGTESGAGGGAGRRFASRPLHFIAIGGAGMSGLALASHRLGARVTGSDRAESTYLQRLRAAGLEPRLGHDADAVPADAEVVVSTAIGDDNPELRRARERGQRVLHRSELLAELCEGRELLAVAGAHGKTTTAGMIVHALREAGGDPAFLLGGELPGAGPGGEPANAGWGSGTPIVVEADESDGSFLRLHPAVAAITNIELDHHSHWAGERALREAFGRFAAGSRIVVLPRGVALAGVSPEREIRFALEGASPGEPPEDVGGAEVVAGGIAEAGGGSEFAVAIAGREPLLVRLSIPGRHNVANATMALAALWAAGAGKRLPGVEELAAALASFPGMARRLERKGERHGAVVYDDYAHHPTEVAACLGALRELPHRRLIAVFQPHLYSRTRALAPRFGRALATADEIILLDVYPAREQPVGELAGVSGLDVADAVADAAPGRRVVWARSLDGAVAALADRIGAGDVVVTIGAGNVFEVADDLVEAG